MHYQSYKNAPGVVKTNIIGENGFAKGDGPPQSSNDVFLLDDSDRRPVV